MVSFNIYNKFSRAETFLQGPTWRIVSLYVINNLKEGREAKLTTLWSVTERLTGQQVDGTEKYQSAVWQASHTEHSTRSGYILTRNDFAMNIVEGFHFLIYCICDRLLSVG